MPRKKVTNDTDVIDGIAEIEDGEQLVEETTRKVRRERVAKPKPEPEPEIIDVVDLEVDEPAEEPQPPFSETSLAARLFNQGESDSYENQFCTVNVRRNPDSMNDKFATPCGATLTLPPLRNIDIKTEQSEIEESVRREYGGGHYFFQIHFGGQLGPSWKTSLSDLPPHMRHQPPAEIDRTPVATPQPVAEPQKDGFDQMLDSLTKTKQLRELLFGDEKERLEKENAELRRAIETRPEPIPAEPPSEKLVILEKALTAGTPDLQKKLLDYAFPEETGSHWIPETLKTIFEHKEEIGGILGGLLGGLAPRQPPTPAGLEAILSQRPPAATLPPPAVPKLRKVAAARPDVTEPETNEADEK